MLLNSGAVGYDCPVRVNSQCIGVFRGKIVLRSRYYGALEIGPNKCVSVPMTF